jgi:hypothetical protein
MLNISLYREEIRWSRDACEFHSTKDSKEGPAAP